MTWGDLKRIVLQKVFASSDQDEPASRAYLDAVPAAAHEGLVLLAAAGLGGDPRTDRALQNGAARRDREVCPPCAATEDTDRLPLSEAAAVLLPLYIASQLYKEDNAGIATQYRNEFEAGVEALASAMPRRSRREAWRSKTGWL